VGKSTQQNNITPALLGQSLRGMEFSMARQYSPRTFLRQVSNHLLKEFFDQRQELAEIPWVTQGETEIGLIYDAWQALPAPQRSEVDRAFQAIQEMACQAGVKALIEEGDFHDLNLVTALEQQEGFYDKAMWAYLCYPNIFNVASLFVSADHLPGRYWLHHKKLPKKTPNTSEQTCRAFADALSEYYRTEQGRGHRCTVETYLRRGRQHYFFAYPDDYPVMYMAHDEEGKFVKRPQKRAFEVVFAYDPQTGSVDMHAQGDRGVKARLFYVFCQVILNENPPPEQPGDHPYELNLLLTEDCRLATDPSDGIQEVRIRKLRLAIGGRRITLEPDPRAGGHDIFDMMTECLRAECLHNPIPNVTQVEFQFRFVAKGYESPKHFSFTVTFPNKSNLKSLKEDYRLLAEKYLKRWKIQRD
jgi:hypothetical protein